MSGSRWFLALFGGALALAACQTPPGRGPFVLGGLSGATVEVRPTVADASGGRGTFRGQALVTGTSASVDHVTVKVFKLSGGTESAVKGPDGGPLQADVASASLGATLRFRYLNRNTTYRIRGYAYNTAGSSSQISDDSASYVDVAVGTDPAVPAATLNIRLADMVFNGHGTLPLHLATGRLADGALKMVAGSTKCESVVTTIAGKPDTAKVVDGSGTAASFYENQGLAFATDGNLYVADHSGYVVRRISPGGVVTTIAGSGEGGWVNGTGTAAAFDYPFGIAAGPDGNLFVTDYYSVRKVTTSGVVTAIAPIFTDSPEVDYVDGDAASARFYHPDAVTRGPDGSLYIAEGAGNQTIRKVSPAGDVTTIAGLGYVWPAPFAKLPVDGTGTAARFVHASGIAYGVDGNLYVADRGARTIRRVTLAGTVTTIAGDGYPGFTDGTGTGAQFVAPAGIVSAPDGSLYVTDVESDTFSAVIRRVTLDGVVTTVAGQPLDGGEGRKDGPAADATFYKANGIALGSDGAIYVAEERTVRKISCGTTLEPPAGPRVRTLAGIPFKFTGRGGAVDGTGIAAEFSDPSSVALDGEGNVYVADLFNHTIRKVTSAGVVTTLAGSPGKFGLVNGTGDAARFNYPKGVAVDLKNSRLLVADSANNVIRTVTFAGVVKTLASGFKTPSDVVVDADGNAYVADTDNAVIRKVTSAGAVTMIAGKIGIKGAADGAGTDATFGYPYGIALASDGTLYVADTTNKSIRKISPAREVSTLASGLSNPAGVAVDGQGNVIVADNVARSISKIAPDGAITVIVSGRGYTDGPASSARVQGPTRVSVDASGVIYFADQNYGETVRMILP